jgi:hypothetical protein
MESGLELSLQTTATNLSSHPTGKPARARDLRTLVLGWISSQELQPALQSSSSLSETFRHDPAAGPRKCFKNLPRS